MNLHVLPHCFARNELGHNAKTVVDRETVNVLDDVLVTQTLENIGFLLFRQTNHRESARA